MRRMWFGKTTSVLPSDEVTMKWKDDIIKRWNLKHCKAAPRVEYLIWKMLPMHSKRFYEGRIPVIVLNVLNWIKGALFRLFKLTKPLTPPKLTHTEAQTGLYLSFQRIFFSPRLRFLYWLLTSIVFFFFLFRLTASQMLHSFSSLHISQPLKASLKFTATKLCLTGLRSTLVEWEKTLLGLLQARVSLKSFLLRIRPAIHLTA